MSTAMGSALLHEHMLDRGQGNNRGTLVLRLYPVAAMRKKCDRHSFHEIHFLKGTSLFITGRCGSAM